MASMIRGLLAFQNGKLPETHETSQKQGGWFSGEGSGRKRSSSLGREGAALTCHPAGAIAPPPQSSSRASPNLAFPVGLPRTGLCSRAWLIRALRSLLTSRGEGRHRGGGGFGDRAPGHCWHVPRRAQLGSVWISQLVMGLARSQLSPSSVPLAITSSWERSLQEPLDLSSGLCLGPREGGSAYSQGSRVFERAWQCTQEVGYLHGVSTASREPLRIPGTAASLLPQSLCRVP